MLKLIIHIAKGVIRDPRSRRQFMAVSLVVAAALLFAGVTFLSGLLISKPVVFIAYWCLCGWFTLLSVLLAIYDLIDLRYRARLERRELKSRIFGRFDKEDDPE